MMKLVAALLLLVATQVVALPGMAAPLSIVGEVTYRERIALPPDAVLGLSLVDMTAKDRPVRVHAETAIEARGQVPLQFSLNFEDTILADGHTYGLVAEIMSGGRVWFRNEPPLPIDPIAIESRPLVIVNFVAGDPPSRDETGNGDLAANGQLIDTLWIVRSVDGASTTLAPRITLTITVEGRAGGSGGCNNYFAEATLDGARLTFGSAAATQRACAPSIMEREQAYFAALGSVRGYALTGNGLRLTDESGKVIIRLTRGTAN